MYLNNEIHDAADLGLDPQDLGAIGVAPWLKDIGSGLKSGLKSASDIYQMQKSAAAAPSQQQYAPQQYGGGAAGGSFLQKHGLKLAIGAGGLLVLFLVLKKKG
jgi:hypothetical protein